MAYHAVPCAAHTCTVEKAWAAVPQFKGAVLRHGEWLTVCIAVTQQFLADANDEAAQYLEGCSKERKGRRTHFCHAAYD